MKKTLDIKRHAWKRVTVFGVRTYAIIKSFSYSYIYLVDHPEHDTSNILIDYSAEGDFFYTEEGEI